MDTCNWERSKGQVTENANAKIVFVTHLCENWIDLREIKTKMILGLFYTRCRIHLISSNA